MEKVLGQDTIVLGLVFFAVIILGWFIKKAFSGSFSRY